VNQSIVDFSDPAAKARFCNDARKLDGRWRVEMRRYRARRSDRQNAAYWSMVVPILADYITAEWGQLCTHDDAHEIIKASILPKRFVNPRTGEEVTVGGSSAALDTERFSVFFDQARQMVTELTGIEIADPDPLHHLTKQPA
jgi:hypothetical protein